MSTTARIVATFQRGAGVHLLVVREQMMVDGVTLSEYVIHYATAHRPRRWSTHVAYTRPPPIYSMVAERP